MAIRESLSKEALDELIKNQDAHCISIYLPTHQKGKEVLSHEDRTAFKVALHEVQKRINHLGYSESQQEQFLAPAKRLWDDNTFWHNMSHSLVIFLSENHFSGFKLPFHVDQYTDLSSWFYLAPLIGLLPMKKQFYLLKLSIKQVELYKADEVAINKVNTQGLLPENLEKVVGDDFEQKYLGYRSLSGGQGGFLTHGYGEGKDDREKELLDYFRAIDHGLKSLIPANNDVHLVIATVDDHFGLYKKINTHPFLMEQNLSGNPDYEGIKDLHKQGLNLLDDKIKEDIRHKKDAYLEGIKNGVSDTNLERIISGSINGKVNRLFINKKAQIYGLFDKAENKPIIHKEKSIHNVDLLNLAGINVYDQKGEVLYMAPEEMPEAETSVNAIYRYV